MAYSRAPWAAPRHMAALPQRSWLRWASSVLKASASSGFPARRTSSASMRTSSKANSASVQPRRPIFLWVPAMLTPGELRSTTTAPTPFFFGGAGDAPPRCARVDAAAPAALGAVPAGKARPPQTGGRFVAAGDVVLVGVEAVAAVAVVGEVRPHEVGRRSRVGLG